MESNEMTKVTYTKDMVIKQVAKEAGKSYQVVRDVYSALEDVVFEMLSSADQNTDVSVRLFEGISFNTTYIPETTGVNNLTGKTVTFASKLKPSANITRNYRDKLTAGER